MLVFSFTLLSVFRILEKEKKKCISDVAIRNTKKKYIHTARNVLLASYLQLYVYKLKTMIPTSTYRYPQSSHTKTYKYMLSERKKKKGRLHFAVIVLHVHICIVYKT